MCELGNKPHDLLVARGYFCFMRLVRTFADQGYSFKDFIAAHELSRKFFQGEVKLHYSLVFSQAFVAELDKYRDTASRVLGITHNECFTQLVTIYLK